MSASTTWVLLVVVATIGPAWGLVAGSANAAAPAMSHSLGLPLDPPNSAVSQGRHFTVDSLNWAGYAVTGATGSVTQVTGSWIQPAVKCGSSTTYAAFWDGIDGYSSDTVEQGGTLAYCAGHHAYYYAWYEFYPAASVEIDSITVHARDTISVTVSYSTSTGEFSIEVQDGSQSYTQLGMVSGAQRTSAECIAERPEVNSGLASLAKFGTAEFGGDYTATIGCSATLGGTTGSFGSFSTVTAINMVDSKGKLLSSTSALSGDGTSFTEKWHRSS